MPQWSLLFIIIIISPFVIGDNDSASVLLVQTSSGPVQGKIVTGFTNKTARAFYGIPYAAPPTGKLRFKPPVPVSPWTEVFDATRAPLPCYQTYTKELLDFFKRLEMEVRRPWSEDCLTLNIWTPAVVPDDTPIVVFFHEGDFLTGSGVYPHYELSTYSTVIRVVAISFNYRVGAFGFLTLDSNEAPGNLGLMDQHLALRWVHDNAQTFGGKRSAVFLVGFGAGAASLGHQIIFDRNAGLFKTALLVAGSPTCQWAWKTKEMAVKLGRSLARDLGCHNKSVESELDCLQRVHPEDIVDATILENIRGSERFSPNVDGNFVKESPTDAMKSGRFNNVTVLAVSMETESGVIFHTLNKELLSQNGGMTEEGFDEAVRLVGLARTETDLTIIRDWYLNQNSRTNTTYVRDQAVHVYSDAFSVCCTSEFVDYAAEADVIAYRMVFNVPDPRFPNWMAAHSLMTLPMVTGDTLNPKRNYGDEVKEATFGIMMAAEIYARKKANMFEEVVPMYNLNDRPYMDWGDVQQVRKQYRTKECQLWNNILPKIRSRRQDCH